MQNTPKDVDVISTAESYAKENEAEVTATKTRNGGETSLVVQIISTMANTVASLGRVADQTSTSKSMFRVLATLFAMSSLDEYSIGLQINGERYRYEDYTVPQTLAALLAPARVVVREVNSAVNFLDRNEYARGIDANNCLTPSEFELEWRKVCARLRVNPAAQKLSRESTMLLANATEYAVNAKRVGSREQAKIIFLNRRFDDEQRDSVLDWAKTFALKMLN